MATPGVIVAVAGAVEARVVQAVDGAPGLTIVRRCADLAEAVGAASAGVGGVVVVSDQPHLTRAVVAELARAGVGVVGIATTPDATAQLDRLGIGEVLGPEAGRSEIAAAVQREAAGPSRPPVEATHDPPAEQETPTPGTVIAVWGPTGAPGRTTLAATLAGEFASQGSTTLLVDADTYGGAVAQACGLTDEAPGLAAVARAAQHGTLDRLVVERYALQVAPRLRVLTGVTRPERWTELPGAALDDAWAVARECADITVVDCGFGLESDEDLVYDTRAPQRNGATLSALQAATTVVAVGTAEPLGIQRLVHGLATLRETIAQEPVVVVNRVRAEVAGVRPEEAVADALLRFAQVARTWMVPWDPRACDAAVLAGQLLTERAPRSRARRAIAALATHLRTHPTGGATPRPPRTVATGVGD